jgi:hypothetical protein
MKYALALIAPLLLAGCHMLSEVPVMKTATITPAELHPGETATIAVEIRDRFNIVDRIETTVVEEPDYSLILRDDGEGTDEKAEDGLWTLKVDVPKEAPAGAFTLQFTAYRSDGQAVTVRDRMKKKSTLQQTIPLMILAPEAAAAAPVEAPAEAAPEATPAP